MVGDVAQWPCHSFSIPSFLVFLFTSLMSQASGQAFNCPVFASFSMKQNTFAMVLLPTPLKTTVLLSFCRTGNAPLDKRTVSVRPRPSGSTGENAHVESPGHLATSKAFQVFSSAELRTRSECARDEWSCGSVATTNA